MILILGNSRLGVVFKNFYKEAAIHITDLLRNKEDVEYLINIHKPQLVINCIVDNKSLNNEMIFISNVQLNRWLADICYKKEVKVVTFSCSSIYKGDNHGQGFSENTTPNNPFTYFSLSKVLMETLLLNYENVVILRLGNIIYDFNDITSAVSNLSTNKCSFIYFEDIVYTVKSLVQQNLSGIFNLANPGLLDFSKYKSSAVKETSYQLSSSNTIADSLLNCHKVYGSIIIPTISEVVNKLYSEK